MLQNAEAVNFIDDKFWYWKKKENKVGYRPIECKN